MKAAFPGGGDTAAATRPGKRRGAVGFAASSLKAGFGSVRVESLGRVMDPHSLALAYSLSSVSGLRASLTILALTIAIHLHAFVPPASMAWVGSNQTLVIVAILAALDFCADKIPGVDLVVHAVHAVLAPVAGGIAAVTVDPSGGEDRDDDERLIRSDPRHRCRRDECMQVDRDRQREDRQRCAQSRDAAQRVREGKAMRVHDSAKRFDPDRAEPGLQ